MRGNNKYKDKELKKPIKLFYLELWLKWFNSGKEELSRCNGYK